jgi:hypothetical protein
MLADPASVPTIVFDPPVACAELDRSIHALEPATLLPLAGPLRSRIDILLAGVRAQLN